MCNMKMEKMNLIKAREHLSRELSIAIISSSSQRKRELLGSAVALLTEAKEILDLLEEEEE